MTDRKPTRGIAVVGTRIWLDVSSHSVVLVRNECTFQAIAFSREDAEEQCTKHWVRHKGIQPWTKRFASQQQPCRWDDDCVGAHASRGLCRRHYAQEKYERDMNDPDAPRCTVEGCERVARKVKRTMCDPHYQRQRKGLPLQVDRSARRGSKPRAPKPPRLCEVEGCGEKHSAEGMCKSHYYRSRPSNYAKPRQKDPKCQVEGCTKPFVAMNYCRTHYDHKRRGRL